MRAVCVGASRRNQFWKSLVLFYNNRIDEAYRFICSYLEEPAKDTWSQLSLLLKYVIRGNKSKIQLLMTPEFCTTQRFDPQNSCIIAALYASLDEKEKSMEWLENAVERGFFNYPFLNEFDPFLENIRTEKRFETLIKKVMKEWEQLGVYIVQI